MDSTTKIIPTLKPTDTWFTENGLGVAKTAVTAIRFVDDYEPGAGAKSWYCSVDVDGGATATAHFENGILTIAGNGTGKIYANAESGSETNGKTGIFKGFTKLVSFDSGILDTSNVKNLYRAFYDCSSIEYLDLTSWNVENVENLQAAFNGMYALKTLLVHNWNTVKLTNMRTTFQCSPSIEVLDLSGWTVDNVTTMYGAFSGHQTYGGFSHLKKVIGIENWNVEKVTDMGGMFAMNDSMTSINLSKWKNTACTSTNTMMTAMTKLSKVTLGKDFRFVGAAPYLPEPSSTDIVGADGKWYTTGGTAYVRNNVPTGVDCTYYASLDAVKNLDVIIKNKILIDTTEAIREKTGTQGRMKPSDISNEICHPTLSSTFLSGISKEMSVETLVFMSESYTGKHSVSWSADTLKSGAITGYLNDKTVIISANDSESIRVDANASNLFADLSLLKTIEGLNVLDFSCVRFFDSAFSNCSSLIEIDLSELNFSNNLVSYDRLFAGCYRLEKVTLWSEVSFVAPSMFFGCIELRKIVGLGKVTEIGEKAFIHVTKLGDGLTYEETSTDIDPNRIVSIGDMACRRSNIEEELYLDPTTSGIQSLRRDRWAGIDLSNIRNFFVENNYEDVYLEVPNTENQYNYPHTILGYDSMNNNTPVSIATWGCGIVATYHEWNAIYNKLNQNDKVYPNFLSWWTNEILAKRPDYVDTNDVNSDSLMEVREILGWTSADRVFVDSVSQLKTIADRLTEGYPVYASIYSTNTLGGMHGVLIIGMNPSSGTLAVLDSAVTSHKGVVSWVKFEDLFVKRAYSNDGSDEDKYYGKDSLRFVSDYHLS